jgi:hypothetical protein
MTDLQPHQQRVVDEKSELDVKIVALTAFIYGNPLHAGLDMDEQDRLAAQLSVMAEYSDILAARIYNFNPPTPRQRSP